MAFIELYFINNHVDTNNGNIGVHKHEEKEKKSTLSKIKGFLLKKINSLSLLDDEFL